MNATPIITRFLALEELDAIGMSLSNAYSACNEFMQLNVVMGAFPIGIEQRPHLLRAFVDHSLMRLADTLPGFHHELKPNAARNCQHVRIHKSGLAITAHYMGRKKFRKSARRAVNRAVLGMRNPDLFGFESTDLDLFQHNGYAQILHGGITKPDMLVIAIPTRDQVHVGAAMSLTIPTPDRVEAESILEEMEYRLKTNTEGDTGNEASAAS